MLHLAQAVTLTTKFQEKKSTYFPSTASRDVRSLVVEVPTLPGGV